MDIRSTQSGQNQHITYFQNSAILIYKFLTKHQNKLPPRIVYKSIIMMTKYSTFQTLKNANFGNHKIHMAFSASGLRQCAYHKCHQKFKAMRNSPRWLASSVWDIQIKASDVLKTTQQFFHYYPRTKHDIILLMRSWEQFELETQQDGLIFPMQNRFDPVDFCLLTVAILVHEKEVQNH